MNIDPASIGTFTTVVGAVIAYVIKDIKRSKEDAKRTKETKKNGDIVQGIKDDIKEVDKKIDILNTKATELGIKVEGAKVTCTSTVARFDSQFSEVQREILELARNRREK